MAVSRPFQALLLAWWGIVGWRYSGLFETFRLDLLPDVFSIKAAAAGRLAALLAAAGWLGAASWALGDRVLRRARLDDEDPFLRISLGCGIIGLLMLALGACRLWEPRLIAAVAVVGTILLGLGGLPRLPRVVVALTPWERLLCCLLGSFAAFNLLGAFIPETFYDALVYHLALPEHYWHARGLVATPENLYSGLPLLTEMLYALALPLGGDRLAHLFNWLFGLCAAGLTFSLGRRLAGRGTGLVAAVLFYSVPTVGVLAWKATSELSWSLFQLSAVYAAIRRLDQKPEDRTWTVLAGVFTGLAMGTRYQAWPMLPIMALLLPQADAARYAGSALAVAAPWVLKNIFFFGNPIYPFLHGGVFPRWREVLTDGGARVASWEGLRSYLLHPWTMTFLDYDFGSLGPAFLLGLPFLFFLRPRTAPGRFLGLYLAGVWLVGSLASSHLRFLIPHLPIAAVLISWAFEAGTTGDFRTACRSGLAVIVLWDFFHLAGWFKAYDGERVVLGLQTPAEYLKVPHASYPRPPYAALEFVNRSLPAEAKVLFLGEARSFPCARDRVSPTLFDRQPFLDGIKTARTALDLRDQLRQAGFTHILLNQTELSYWQSRFPEYAVLTAQNKLYQEFRKDHAKPLFIDKGAFTADYAWPWTAVYELR